MSDPIYSIGTQRLKQAAMRADGIWFERYKRTDKPGWGKWHRTPDDKRPDYAWYNPQAGRAKLPTKDTIYDSKIFCEPAGSE